MKFVIPGGTGFIGRALVARLLAENHDVTVLTRRPPERGWPHGRPAPHLHQWHPEDEEQSNPTGLSQVLRGADAVVQLAGATIGRRWTAAYKERILQSRVQGMTRLVDAIRELPADQRPSTLLATSGVGYYGPRGDEVVTETEGPGSDFLARVSHAVEEAALAAQDLGVRVVCLRNGLVLGPGGGVLPLIALPFKLFIGGPLGSGRQWMPWIHLDDLTGMIRFIVEHEEIAGPVNATAPKPVTNRDFGRAMGRVLQRPAFLPTPALPVKLLLGEMSMLALTGQRAVPHLIQQHGFTFEYEDVESALRAAL